MALATLPSRADSLHATRSPGPAKSAGHSSPLLSLPRELRLQIWNELLQNPPEFMAELYSRFLDPSLFTEYLGETFFSLSCPREYRAQPQILRVCRLVYEEATPIFYANMVFINIPRGPYYNLEILNDYKRLIECLRCPRPINLQKLFFIVHAGINYAQQDTVVQHNVALIQEISEALSNVACYERVWVHLADWTLEHAFGLSVDRSLNLMQGFGMLYCKELHVDMVLKETSAALEWAMRRPGPVAPLPILHRDLVTYLNKYDPDDAFNGRNWTLKEFFIAQSERAMRDLDVECFFLNRDVAIDYILEIVGKGLSAALVGNEAEHNVIISAREEGDKMKLLGG